MMRSNSAKTRQKQWPENKFGVLKVASYYLPLFAIVTGEWLKIWLIHSTAAGEYSCSNDASKRQNNQYLSHYSKSDLRKILCVGVGTYLKCMHMHVWIFKCILLSMSCHPKPNFKLMHYGSLDKYTGSALITEMKDACCFAPLYLFKRVHLQLCVFTCTQTGHWTQRDSRQWIWCPLMQDYL